MRCASFIQEIGFLCHWPVIRITLFISCALPKAFVSVFFYSSRRSRSTTFVVLRNFALSPCMPSRRRTSAAFGSTRGSAAVVAQLQNGLKPSVPAPVLEHRDAIWSGWCPQIFEQLCAMNQLAFGGETDELLRQRRTQTSSDDLPAFSRDWCPFLLLDILPHVDVWPDAAINNPVGAQVREPSDVQYSLIYDLPLPVIIRRRRIALIVLAENGLSSQRTRHWPVRSDIARTCAQAIFVSRQCAVTTIAAVGYDSIFKR